MQDITKVLTNNLCLQGWRIQTHSSSWASNLRRTDSMWRILDHRLVGQLYFLLNMLVHLSCTCGCTSGPGSFMVTKLEMLSPCPSVLSKWSYCCCVKFCIHNLSSFPTLFYFIYDANLFPVLLQVAGLSIMPNASLKPSLCTGSPTAPCLCSIFSRTAPTTGVLLLMWLTMSTTHCLHLLPLLRCMCPWLSSW